MSLVSAQVVRRYLAKKATFSLVSDERFRPPKWLVNGVTPKEEGGAEDLPFETLNVWKYVAANLAGHFDYGAATKYWRNKCLKMEYAIPEKYLVGGGGEGAAGPWAVKSGDQIEEWVKANLKSQGFLVELGRSRHDWQLEISSLERELAEAEKLVTDHLAGLVAGDRVKQRQGWLEKAQTKLEGFKKQMFEAQSELTKLLETANRYDEHLSPTLAFEQQFQFTMLQAQKSFDKKTVIDAVHKALERFEADLAMPGFEGMKSAGLLEDLLKKLSSAWDYVTNAISSFFDWVKDLGKTTQELDKLLKSAGA